VTVSFVSIAFDTGIRRRPSGSLGQFIRFFGAALSLWVLYSATYSRLDALSITISFYSGMLALAFLIISPSANSGGEKVSIVDIVASVLSIATGAYFLYHADTIAARITLLDPLTLYDVVFGSLIVALTIEIMRRTVGLGLTVIVILFMIYNLFGDLLSGVLSHGVISYTHFLDVMTFTTDGLFGVPLRVAATYAFLFVMFGTALAKCGGSEFFFNLAAALTGRTAGGPAKIAVISSGLYGTISGSPTSDVVTTGAITIPMMKRLGYSPRFAGAVEVAASTGGSLLPPVMGAAAFIMAEYTGIPYSEIAIAALIPALLYYIPIYVQVHLRAKRLGLKGLSAEDVPKILPVLKNGFLFIIPLVAISWSLINGYTPTYSAVYGLLAVLIVSFLKKSTRIGFKALLEILSETATRMVPVAGACAAAGLVIGGITMTGLASKFGVLVFAISGQDVFISLVVAAALTLLLGLGMPTPSAYILAAVLIAPVMVKLQIPALQGHMFLLYFAVMSALTPPVAVAAYAASALAEANPLTIALDAVKISIGAFLVPFAFVFNDAILMKGPVLQIIWSVSSVTLGLVAIAIAVEGYLRGSLNPYIRFGLAAAGLCLLSSQMIPAIVGVAIILGVGLVLGRRWKSA
jgi:TRAP transporter 4TM/12TM fusion protein